MSSVFDPQLPGGSSSYIHWRPEHSRYAVELKPDLVAAMTTEVAAAREAGMEAGGVLIGSFPPTLFPTVRVESFLRVQRRAEDGPFYAFTPEQQERFTVARRNANTRETSAVGFFRSQLREGPLELSPEDRALLAGEFKRSIHLALVIEAAEPRHAVLYMSNEGVMPDMPSIPRFLFQAEALRSLTTVHPAFKPSRLERGASIGNAPPSRDYEPITNMNVARYGLVAFTAALAFVGGLVIRPILPVSSLEPMLPSTSEFLDLRASRDRELVRVVWNHKAPEAQRAKAATLSISEGLRRREIHLDRDEMASGVIEFQPSGKQALIVLTLEMPGSTRIMQTVTWEGS